MLVMMLPSPTHDGAIEFVLVVARQGAAIDHLSVTADSQATTSAHQGATVDCSGGAIDCFGAPDVHQGAIIDRLGLTGICQVVTADRQGAAADCQGATTDCQGATHDCWSLGCRCRLPVTEMSPPITEKGSHYEVLTMEVIDLDVWIFTLTLRWVPTVMVCDSDLE
jgi:hypothetical protein